MPSAGVRVFRGLDIPPTCKRRELSHRGATRIIRPYDPSSIPFRSAVEGEREEEEKRQVDRSWTCTYYAHRIVKFHVEKTGEEGPISGTRTGCVFHHHHHGPIERADFSRLYAKTQRSLLYSLICSARWINPSIFAARVARRVSSSSLFLYHPSSSSTGSVCSGLFTDIVTDVSRENPGKFRQQLPAPGFPILPQGW